MTRVQLQEIANIHGGGRLKLCGNHFVSEGVPAYGAAGQNGFVATAEYEDREAVILSSIGARCGKCFHVRGAWTSLANTQVVVPDLTRVDSRFLWFQLNDEDRWPRSGSAQPFIKPSDVKRHIVWLPPLAEQRRIAAILDQADALRAKRRQALAHLDDLTHSVFGEMLARSPTETVHFQQLCTGMHNGLSPSSQGSVAARVLTLSAVTRGAFDPTANKQGLFASEPADGVRVGAKDFLICRGNGNRDLVGVGVCAGVDHPDLVFPDTVIAASLDHKRVDLTYLAVAWSQPSVRAQIASAARTTSGIHKVNQKAVGSVLITLPSLDDQRAFARRESAIAELRRQHQAAQRREHKLFETCQARAFTGRL